MWKIGLYIQHVTVFSHVNSFTHFNVNLHFFTWSCMRHRNVGLDIYVIPRYDIQLFCQYITRMLNIILQQTHNRLQRELSQNKKHVQVYSLKYFRSEKQYAYRSINNSGVQSFHHIISTNEITLTHSEELHWKGIERARFYRPSICSKNN